MTARGRRALVALTGLAGLLFAGRWIVAFLSENWWAGAASPAGSVFAIRWAMLEASLELGAILASTAWFAAGLLLAARLGARAGALRPSSAGVVPPGSLRSWALGVAVLLGVLTGAGSGAWAPDVALALEAPRFGLLDAQYGRDIGFFLATLPVLLLLQQFLLALTILGFVATTMLYTVAGALRFTSRDYSLDPAIRLHLGALGALLALLLGAGYLLEPLQLAAGLQPSMGAAHLLLLSSLARLLAGFAIAVAVLTLAWGVRGRMMLPVGGWASFALFAIAIRLLAPAAGGTGDTGQTGQVHRDLEREAFSIPEPVEDAGAGPGSLEALMPELWSPDLVVPDAGAWLGADRLGTPRPGREGGRLLLVGASDNDPGVRIFEVASDLATAAGGPLSVRDGDQEPLPGVVARQALPAATANPGAVLVRVHGDGPGVPAGGFLRRLALTWALQEDLLGSMPLAW